MRCGLQQRSLDIWINVSSGASLLMAVLGGVGGLRTARGFVPFAIHPALLVIVDVVGVPYGACNRDVVECVQHTGQEPQ